MTSGSEQTEPQLRLRKVFEFLKAFNDLRNPPIRRIDQQQKILSLTDIPDHPSVELFCNGTAADDESDNAGIILRVTRPTLTRCPLPPASIAGWVRSGWENIDSNAEIRTSMNATEPDNQTRVENFSDAPERVEAFTKWRDQRQQWKINEWPVRQSATLFQTTYEWFGICERETEQIELLVGDGLLNCPDEGGDFNHQILLQRVDLEFNPERNNPQFTFRKRDRPPELYLEFLPHCPEPIIVR